MSKDLLVVFCTFVILFLVGCGGEVSEHRYNRSPGIYGGVVDGLKGRSQVMTWDGLIPGVLVI